MFLYHFGLCDNTMGRAFTAGQQSAQHPKQGETGCTGAVDLLAQVADLNLPAHIWSVRLQPLSMPCKVAGIPPFCARGMAYIRGTYGGHVVHESTA